MDDERREGEREDPILRLGRDPVDDGGPRDGSTNHDSYIYGDSHGDLRDVECRAGDDFAEREWLSAASSNPAFAFLYDPKEDIYSLEDGQAYRDEPGSHEE